MFLNLMGGHIGKGKCKGKWDVIGSDPTAEGSDSNQEFNWETFSVLIITITILTLPIQRAAIVSGAQGTRGPKL